MKDQKPGIKLTDIPKKEVLNVPDGYFENLAAKIERKIDSRDEKVIEMPAVPWMRYGLAAAASLALFVVAFFLLRNDRSVNSAEELLAEISAGDCLAYLNSTSGIETEEIILAFGTELVSQELLSEDTYAPSVDELYDESLFEEFGVTIEDTLPKI